MDNTDNFAGQAASYKRKTLEYYKKHRQYNLLQRLYQKFMFKRSVREIDFNSLSIDSNQKYDKNLKICVYTSIYGRYDSIQEPLVKPENIDYCIFTDTPLPDNSRWSNVEIDFPSSANTNILKNRYVKMMSHKLFPDYDITIYIDGNIKVMSDLNELIGNMNEYGFAMYKHSDRNCVYDEITALKRFKRANKYDLNVYRKKLKKSRVPKRFGLLEAPIIVREVNNNTAQKINELWWREFLQTPPLRDQLALIYVVHNLKLDINHLGSLGPSIYGCLSLMKVPHI